MSDERQKLVALAQAPGVNLTQLAKRFGVSRKTLYKWKSRAAEQPGVIGGGWALDQSRRPGSCPWRTAAGVEQQVADLRREYPCWGPRKLRHVMEQKGVADLPSTSTIAAILHRLGLIDREESLKRVEFVRFERSRPNELWQMDFKGPFAVGQGKCHPLTIVDDHSRFGLCVCALPGESGEVTRPALTEVFRLYGLPECMLLDNGSCWGRVGAVYTAFTAWLLRLGVRVSYARPYHPQTKGKNERFNRTLKGEAIGERYFNTLHDWQKQFDKFLLTYNTVRPHEGIEMAVPSSRYQVSPRAFPEHLPQIEYLEGDVIRQVGQSGYLSWNKQRFHVGRAFGGDPVAMRPTRVDGVFEVFYCYQRIAIINRHTEGCEQVQDSAQPHECEQVT